MSFAKLGYPYCLEFPEKASSQKSPAWKTATALRQAWRAALQPRKKALAFCAFTMFWKLGKRF
jgi:hypothetical protein